MSLDDEWEIILRVRINQKNVNRLFGLEEKAERKGGFLPNWRAGLAFVNWYAKHGVKMELLKWTMRRPVKP
jgi:hypothetical protein